MNNNRFKGFTYSELQTLHTTLGLANYNPLVAKKLFLEVEEKLKEINTPR